MTIDNMKVGSAIASLRQARGLTQQQLAATMSVSHQAVSKWENGQALPDVQTLTALATLFGVTMEQLLSGDIPASRLQGDQGAPQPIKDIGQCIKGVFDGIGDLFQPPKAEEDDGAQEARVEEGAPKAEEEEFDVEKLIQTAPFMTRAAIEEMLSSRSERFSPNVIARLAPFVGSDCLEKMIARSEAVVNWDTLRSLAPFLKREVVDRLAKAAAKGEKYVRPAANDLAKAFDEFGRAVGKNVDTAVRSVVKFGENVVNDITKPFSGSAADACPDAQRPRSAETAQVRRMVFERALEEDRWDWLAEHMEELSDEALIRKIAAKACESGKQDWVLQHVKGFANAELILAAMNAGNWDWLSTAVMGADAQVQKTVAQAAAQQGAWDWLEENCAAMEIEDIAGQLAVAAYEDGAKDAAIAMVTTLLEEPDVENLARKALEKGDQDFFAALAPHVGISFINDTCVALAAADEWESVYDVVAFADQPTVGRLTELAMEKGNWEAVDHLDDFLN